MNTTSTPSWWAYVGDIDRLWLNELDRLIRERKPVPESDRLSILLALQRVREHGGSRTGRPRKDVQYFWLVFHYLLCSLTEQSKKAAALRTALIALEAGISVDYKAIQRKANEDDLLTAVCEFRDVILASNLLPQDAQTSHAVLLSWIEDQVQKVA